VAARGDAALAPPAPAASQGERLLTAYGALPAARDNDGIVPTNSQIWGQLVHATAADHLDVVGQFGRIDEGSWAADWIPSYSGFSRVEFAALWAAVAAFILAGPGFDRTPAATSVGSERTERDLSDPT